MGIDYGMGQTNIDKKTGIRYGVISQNECLQAWADSAEAEYFKGCPYCGEELKQGKEYRRCPKCYKAIRDDETYGDQASGFTLDDGEYKASQGGDDSDIFVILSPYYTLCTYCSPCAPGAGYLMTPGDVKAYCFGHDFFEDGKAPYKIFRVEDDSEVKPDRRQG